MEGNELLLAALALILSAGRYVAGGMARAPSMEKKDLLSCNYGM